MKRLILALITLLFLTQTAFAGELYILGITASSINPSTVYAGDLITLNVDVENVNSLGLIAEEVTVRAELNENDFEPVKVSEYFSEIKGRGIKTVSLRFKAKDTVLPGNYTIPVFLEYKNRGSQLIQPVDISFVVSSCSTLKVKEISLSNFQPHIGDILEVSAMIQNPCTSSFRNVNIELKPVSNTTIEPFVVPSGTTKKIDNILPGETEKVTFSINITDNVDVQSYVFDVVATCTDCESASNKFSFLVLGRPEIVFSNIEYSVDVALGSDKKIMPGSLMTFSVQLDNIGEEKAKAVDVEVDFGEAIQGTTKAFLGNIDADDSGAAIFNLTIPFDAEAGKHEGVITVSYTDELGNPQQITETYFLYVAETTPAGIFDYIILGIVIIIILVLIYFITKFAFRQITIMRQSR